MLPPFQDREHFFVLAIAIFPDDFWSMDEKKLLEERIKAKANWELLKLRHRAGKASSEEVEAAWQVSCKLGKHTPSSTGKARETTEKPYVPGATKVEQVNSAPEMVLSLEMTRLIQELETQRSTLDVEKRNVSMKLQQVPASVPCPELTERIMNLRRQWEELGDRIWYVKRNGQLPENAPPQDTALFPTKFTAELPRDKFELDRMIKNLAINVQHKWPAKVSAAKTSAKKAEYERKIAVGLAKLEVMQAFFVTL
ncbi:hypothetical protein [Arundinibacter roseus]|uniref:Uncharacterized protein n=1 Tax=Arundinibacter roseus TaxID=2070510 RepID=A0A4R4K0Y7_9BACT|nr:hypothetical protein [Arundinibacter roseus]TDB60086.1 hypothetical protein EZE20_21685 [Arundinibacter roseus]